jgi:hypothetical protein
MPDPADDVGLIAQAIVQGGGRAAVTFGRDWLVPTVTASGRTGSQNPEAGEFAANIRDSQIAVLWDGTNTFLPFTVNVSFIESSGLSDDLVMA